MVNMEFVNLRDRAGLNNRQLSQLTDLHVDVIKRIAKGLQVAPKQATAAIKNYINYIGA